MISIVVLAGLCLACSGAGEASTGSTGVDEANTGPVSGTGGEVVTTGGGTSGQVTTGGGTSGQATTSGGSSSDATTSGGSSGTTGAAGCPERAPWGMWVWQPEQATDPAKSALLLEFAAAHEVTHLYLESEALLVEDPERLVAFIGEADAACVAVELLFGAAAWAQAEHHAEPLALVEDALALVDGLVGPRPVGLHFDIEPHGLPDWDLDPEGYAGEYLDLLDMMAANMQGSELSLTVDIAFWYDTVMVERDGAKRPLNELVQDRVDRVVVMDYRDHAEPPDGIIDNAAAEVDYAEQVGGLVRVAVESTCGIVPEKVTFCEEGSIAMFLALELTASIYAASPAWDGVAVHDHAAWSVLMD
jgi:hypothetical protein